MQSKLSIDDLTAAVIQEIKKFGLDSVVNWQYWRVYEDFKVFAVSRGVFSFQTS